MASLADMKVDDDGSLASSVTTMKQLNHFLRSNPKAEVTQSAKVLAMLKGFVESNADPKTSPNLSYEKADDMTSVAYLLGWSVDGRTTDWIIVLLQMLKILLRKAENRAKTPDSLLKALSNALRAPPTVKCAIEACNALLNLCFDEVNVLRILQHKVVPSVVAFLSSSNKELQASACGALQSICFQGDGRDQVRNGGALAPLCALLSSKDSKVLLRVVGALHNMSSDPKSIAMIREADGLLPLVALLRMPSTPICGSAAGAIQNVSREPLSREIIRDTSAVEALTELLVSSDPQSQVCAAGALLNILGPVVGGDDPTHPDRIALCSLLSDGIALGAVVDCMTDSSATKDP